MLLHADRILNPELFHWRNISTADLGIFSLGRKISASQSLPRNIFASENIPAGKSILAEYSGCYTGALNSWKRNSPIPLPFQPKIEEVRRITRQEMEIEARKNNVVLAGVSCSDSTNVEEVVKTLLPDIQIEVLAVKKLGEKQRTHGSGSVSDQPPSRIQAELTPRGKAALWERRRSLTCNEKPVYVNHDLTRAVVCPRARPLALYYSVSISALFHLSSYLVACHNFMLMTSLFMHLLNQ